MPPSAVGALVACSEAFSRSAAPIPQTLTKIPRFGEVRGCDLADDLSVNSISCLSTASVSLHSRVMMQLKLPVSLSMDAVNARLNSSTSTNFSMQCQVWVLFSYSTQPLHCLRVCSIISLSKEVEEWLGRCRLKAAAMQPWSTDWR